MQDPSKEKLLADIAAAAATFQVVHLPIVKKNSLRIVL